MDTFKLQLIFERGVKRGFWKYPLTDRLSLRLGTSRIYNDY